MNLDSVLSQAFSGSGEMDMEAIMNNVHQAAQSLDATEVQNAIQSSPLLQQLSAVSSSSINSLGRLDGMDGVGMTGADGGMVLKRSLTDREAHSMAMGQNHSVSMGMEQFMEERRGQLARVVGEVFKREGDSWQEW